MIIYAAFVIIVIKEKMLPIEITPESGVVHFYTGVCGQHMSVRAEISLNESFKGTSYVCRLFFAFHKGIFDQFKLKHRKVFAQYEDKVVLLVDDTETTFKQSGPEILDKFTSHGPVPQGVLTKEIGESLLVSPHFMRGRELSTLVVILSFCLSVCQS